MLEPRGTFSPENSMVCTMHVAFKCEKQLTVVVLEWCKAYLPHTHTYIYIIHTYTHIQRHLLQTSIQRVWTLFFVFSGLPFCEASGWSAMEQLAEVQVLRLTMELALVRAEAGDTMQADDH